MSPSAGLRVARLDVLNVGSIQNCSACSYDSSCRVDLVYLQILKIPMTDADDADDAVDGIRNVKLSIIINIITAAIDFQCLVLFSNEQDVLL